MSKREILAIFVLLILGLITHVSINRTSFFAEFDEESDEILDEMSEFFDENQENLMKNRVNVYVSASFRSGSSFVGSVFDQNPDFLYARL